MFIQDWHTEVRLQYQRCGIPSEVADRLQRNIFVIGLKDTFKRFWSDITRDNFTSLTFSQVVTKDWDYEDGLKTERAISQHKLKESAGIRSSLISQLNINNKPRLPLDLNHVFNLCGRSTHPRCAWPAKKSFMPWLWKAGTLEKLCSKSSPQPKLFLCKPDNDIYCVKVINDLNQQAPKGIFVDLEISTNTGMTPLKFQVDSGCSCNILHQSDLDKF